MLVVIGGPAAEAGLSAGEVALAGSLARRLAEHSGRGAVVESIGRIDLHLADMPPLLAAARLERFDAVVLVAGAPEMSVPTSATGWAVHLEAALRTIDAGRTVTGTVLVAGVPVPSGAGDVRVRRRPMLHERASALNGVSKEVIASRPHGRFAQLEDPPGDGGRTTAACCSRWADQICSVLEPLLTGSVLDPGAGTSR